MNELIARTVTGQIVARMRERMLASVLSKRCPRRLAGMVLALALIGAPALAAAFVSAGERPAHDDRPPRCFLRREWTGAWRVTPDARTLYIDVSGAIYRLDLDGEYPLLRSPWAVLHDTDSAASICTAVDFRLSVTDHIGNQATPIVKKLTLLTAAEVAALPKKLRP